MQMRVPTRIQAKDVQESNPSEGTYEVVHVVLAHEQFQHPLLSIESIRSMHVTWAHAIV